MLLYKMLQITEICSSQFFSKKFSVSITFSKSFSPLIKNQLVHHTSLTRKHFWIQSKLRPSVSYLLPIKKRIDSSVFSVFLSHLLALLTFLHREKIGFQKFDESYEQCRTHRLNTQGMSYWLSKLNHEFVK